MLYRTLRPDDFDDALALYRELSGTRPVADGDFGRDRFREVLDRDGTAIYGAEMDGSIVSMATIHLMPNMTYGGRPYALVENVVTLKTHQGRGIGRGVMNALIDAAWAADAYKVMLLTGRRAEASGFYEKLGFDGDEKHGMILRKA
ncbi:GNAT family N-acetyltransferase [Nisaea sp.]|uniref:GNAT family N-acetyltransferase n=1 Tax=Nisaea sp. TaxID=2024842 RepID=UPI002B274FC7|nr:GNAT family N-acetyltransferase [Nisaea sp.]